MVMMTNVRVRVCSLLMCTFEGCGVFLFAGEQKDAASKYCCLEMINDPALLGCNACGWPQILRGQVMQWRRKTVEHKQALGRYHHLAPINNLPLDPMKRSVLRLCRTKN